jgi:hypothetical protein
MNRQKAGISVIPVKNAARNRLKSEISPKTDSPFCITDAGLPCANPGCFGQIFLSNSLSGFRLLPQ